MSGDQAIGLFWALGALVIVGSALAARKMPAAKLGKMALAWIGIFVVAITLAVLWGMITHRGPSIRVAPTDRDQLTILHNVYYQTERSA